MYTETTYIWSVIVAAIAGILIGQGIRIMYRQMQVPNCYLKISREAWITYLERSSDLEKKKDLATGMLYYYSDLTKEELTAIYVYIPKHTSSFWEKDHGKIALKRLKKYSRKKYKTTAIHSNISIRKLYTTIIAKFTFNKKQVEKFID